MTSYVSLGAKRNWIPPNLFYMSSLVIPMKLKGFLAWVLVDGKDINQYGVEIKENMATCWIPSEAGKASIICYHQ